MQQSHPQTKPWRLRSPPDDAVPFPLVLRQLPPPRASQCFFSRRNYLPQEISLRTQQPYRGNTQPIHRRLFSLRRNASVHPELLSHFLFNSIMIRAPVPGAVPADRPRIIVICRSGTSYFEALYFFTRFAKSMIMSAAPSMPTALELMQRS